MTGPLLNHFDRNKPFYYPSVMDYLAGLHGCLSLLTRGLGQAVLKIEERIGTPDVYLADDARMQC